MKRRPPDPALNKLILELHDSAPHERVVFVSKENHILVQVHPDAFSAIAQNREFLRRGGSLKAIAHIANQVSGLTRTTYVEYVPTGDVYTVEWTAPLSTPLRWTDPPEASAQAEIKKSLGKEDLDRNCSTTSLPGRKACLYTEGGSPSTSSTRVKTEHPSLHHI